jgi:hypothetical protein
MTDKQYSPRGRLTLASAYGVAGLLTAVAVHASTFTAVPLRPEHPLFWMLHIGIFPLFIPMVWRLRAWREQTRGMLGLPTSRLRWRELLAYLPAWAIAIAGVLFAYAMVNFFLAMSHLPAGHAAGSGSIGVDEARYTVRAFSGHWMIFYAIPTLFFFFVPATARPDESGQAAV